MVTRRRRRPEVRSAIAFSAPVCAACRGGSTPPVIPPYMQTTRAGPARLVRSLKRLLRRVGARARPKIGDASADGQANDADENGDERRHARRRARPGGGGWRGRSLDLVALATGVNGEDERAERWIVVLGRHIVPVDTIDV